MKSASALTASALSLFAVGCTAGDLGLVYTPPPPPNVVVTGPIEAAAGHELIMGDNLFQPGAVIPAHSHPGEEFLLVQAGEVILQIAGEDERVLQPGDALRIPPGAVHSAVVGPAGARVISNWIKPQDAPLRIPGDTDGGEE